LSEKRRNGVSTFITQDAGMGGRDGARKRNNEELACQRVQPKTRTVFQYHGCSFHGCPKCFPHYHEQMIINNGKTPEELYQATLNRTAFLRESGYEVIEAWSCEVGHLKGELPRTETKTYPHAILYDFEAYGDNNHWKELTPALMIENAHMPISVSVGDTLEREPTHICKRDPVELVRKFMEELERRGKNIRAQVRAEFVPEDAHLLPKAQRQRIDEWCNQVPGLGFNSGRYDLNLIKNHFAGRLAKTSPKVRVAKKREQKHVLSHLGIPFPRYHQLPWAGNELREMGESLRMQDSEIVVSIRMV